MKKKGKKTINTNNKFNILLFYSILYPIPPPPLSPPNNTNAISKVAIEERFYQ